MQEFNWRNNSQTDLIWYNIQFICVKSGYTVANILNTIHSLLICSLFHKNHKENILSYMNLEVVKK